MLAAILAWAGATPLADDALDRALAKPADSYIVELTAWREGQSSRVNGPDAYRGQWRYGPTRARVHLVNWVLGSDEWNPTDSLHTLERWSELVDQELARIQMVRQAGEGPLLNPMLAFADEDERVVRAAAARLEDIAVLLRLLHGIQYYDHVGDNGGDARQPVSAPPVISFEGGEKVHHSRSQYSENTSVEAAQGWTDHEAESMRSAARYVALVVWRFDPADMARARELAAQSATIIDELTYRSENVHAELIDERFGYGWEDQARHLHFMFRDALREAIRDLAKYAWTLTPKAPPAGLFAEGPEAQRWLGELAPDAPLNLPEVTGDRLVRLIMPVAGLNELHLRAMDGKSRTGSLTEFDWFYYFPVTHLTPIKSDRLRVHPSTSSGTEHQFGFHHPFVMSIIDGDVAGPRFGGEVSQIAEFENSYPDSAGTTVVEEARDVIRVQWTAAYQPAPASPAEEPMLLSFARPQGGKPMPFEGTLDYGDAFYVEGRMEKPATREVYRIFLQVPDGTEHDVFLRPTKEDPSLLRSDLLYVMWDVSGQDDAQ